LSKQKFSSQYKSPAEPAEFFSSLQTAQKLSWLRGVQCADCTRLQDVQEAADAPAEFGGLRVVHLIVQQPISSRRRPATPLCSGILSIWEHFIDLGSVGDFGAVLTK